MSDRTTRLVGLYSVIAGVAVVFLSPLLALAYFATADGAESEVSLWADPARKLVGGLLTFASPERVYGAYLQGFALLFPAAFLCAVAVRSHRRGPEARLERWGWRVTLLGYGALSLGLVLAFWLEVAAVLTGGNSSHNGVLNAIFLSLLLPGILLGTTGSTILGLGLLRASYRPRATALLLALGFPLWIVGSFALGHNSLGLAPLMVAWGITGLQLWRSGAAPVVAASRQPTMSPAASTDGA
jgi:uncharacterized protein YjeT (DUF2065 family)